MALVRRADAELLELDHDRIGESVLRRLEAARRPELHAQLARALEADDLHGEAALAQYMAAGLPDAAAQCARQAGYLALGALAFARAAWLFRKALELERWPDATRAHLYGELALACEHAGRGLEAAEAYRAAAALTEDRAASMRLEAMAAVHLAGNGRKDEGLALVRHCYSTLDIHWPRSRVGLALSLLKQLVLVQLPKRGAPGAGAALARVRARMLSDVGQALDGCDPLHVLHNALLALREGDRVQDEEWRARTGGLRGLLRCNALLPGGVERGLAEIQAATEPGTIFFHQTTDGIRWSLRLHLRPIPGTRPSRSGRVQSSPRFAPLIFRLDAPLLLEECDTQSGPKLRLYIRRPPRLRDQSRARRKHLRDIRLVEGRAGGVPDLL